MIKEKRARRESLSGHLSGLKKILTGRAHGFMIIKGGDKLSLG